jgi:membrane protease YdiL (CAAX protease family)
VALLEVLLCSDFPTQITIAAMLHASGLPSRTAGGDLSIAYVVTLTTIDTIVLIGLILSFLHAHGERPRDVFLGARPVGRELAVGVLLILPAFVLVVGVVHTVRSIAPWLHDVETNPLETMLRSPSDYWIFALTAIVGGGLREEMQRAFVLHRFERHLGGGWLGLVVFSAVFGLGHLLQGWDVAIGTALLGAFWGAVYLVRQSIVAPVVSHGSFNVAEIVLHGLVR